MKKYVLFMFMPMVALTLMAQNNPYTETRTPIELFEKTLKGIGSLAVKNRTLWLVNPHYETKFGLRPRRLPQWIARLPYVRNFFTTSCFYVLADGTD